MSKIVDGLFEERAKLWESMKELNDREIAEERSLDASEKEQWDKMNDRMSEIDARVQELASVEEANKKSEVARSGIFVEMILSIRSFNPIRSTPFLI